jgi:AAA+ superfamily predicted ATPase
MGTIALFATILSLTWRSLFMYLFTKPISSEIEISSDLNGLQPLLQKLDRSIQQAISIRQTKENTEENLERSWLEKSEISSEEIPLTIRSNSLLAWLQKTFNLSTFDLDILTIAIAPELDRSYEKIYAYLQDDVINTRPTVDLFFNLLSSSIPEKLSRRKHFTSNSPLISNRLLYLSSASTLLSQHLILDSQIIRLLLQQPGLDFRLTSCSQLLESDRVSNTLYLKEDVQATLEAIALEDWQKQKPLILYFQGSDRTGKRHTAQIIAKKLECSLLIADLAKLLEDKNNFEEKIQLLWREAWWFDRLLYLDNFDLLYLSENQILYRSFLVELEKNRGITILAGLENWIPTTTGIKGVMTVPFNMPEFGQRRECWEINLKEAQIEIEDAELDVLSDRFVLTPDQIADAVSTAYNKIRWQAFDRKTEKTQSLFLHLCSAARAQSGHDLANLARKIEPKYSWDDIVLHLDRIRQLQDICKEAEYRELVYQKWGFAAKLSLGKGINVLFSGSPGTGKTMAAEVIAHHLQLDLYKIDLSQIVSKYIGETEKNLNRIFNAATNSNAILLFDEADALFGKRSEVRDARDRYANIEVGYLLQKIEEYEGIAILTTNLRDNIDKAFERRLRFIINFNLPDAENRYLIWQKVFPKNTPCSADLDLKFLAQNFEITGANIRHIALTAAFLAVDNSGIIDMNHIIQALQREYQKMGQVLRTRDLGQYL